MSEHEVVFEGRERTRAQHFLNVQATIIGVHKLVERARTGVEVDDNISCAKMWLRIAADELDVLLKGRKK
jgi:hypothetical protein